MISQIKLLYDIKALNDTDFLFSSKSQTIRQNLGQITLGGSVKGFGLGLYASLDANLSVLESDVALHLNNSLVEDGIAGNITKGFGILLFSNSGYGVTGVNSSDYALPTTSKTKNLDFAEEHFFTTNKLSHKFKFLDTVSECTGERFTLEKEANVSKLDALVKLCGENTKEGSTVATAKIQKDRKAREAEQNRKAVFDSIGEGAGFEKTLKNSNLSFKDFCDQSDTVFGKLKVYAELEEDLTDDSVDKDKETLTGYTTLSHVIRSQLPGVSQKVSDELAKLYVLGALFEEKGSTKYDKSNVWKLGAYLFVGAKVQIDESQTGFGTLSANVATPMAVESAETYLLQSGGVVLNVLKNKAGGFFKTGKDKTIVDSDAEKKKVDYFSTKLDYSMLGISLENFRFQATCDLIKPILGFIKGGGVSINKAGGKTQLGFNVKSKYQGYKIVSSS